ncbi:MBL fold metallo-hydrolase [Pararhodobacter zhoushanensis]|uniref:MBL fold metallo-hydrolase n=1 Tax=Pararhodobacter zhoushanensis TaxID=2479545 RepID=A0ABT3H528_9RHOB|nr:MBL fold metallo-hydrolase [Pararhodobacter zhoushanensis]MCW1934917.1 MBL fold metallo-hydrolase [Pararhodobacter zhoushanensis]
MARRALPPLPTDPYECLIQGCERPWEVAVDPFPVAPRTWYVGNNWVGAYLLQSSEGLILIDTTMQPQVYLVFESIRKLGFDITDLKLILVSHMHYDHLGGVRPLVEASGAKVMMSREDWAFLNDRPDQLLNNGYPWGSFEPDAFYSDNEPVVMGDREIRTLLTPGHTPGTTSFFFDVPGEAGATHLCGLHGGAGVITVTNEYLRDNNLPMALQQQYLETMLRVRDMPVDITLGSHPAQVAMMDRVDDIRDGHNPFLDRAVWPRMIDGRLDQIRKVLEQTE